MITNRGNAKYNYLSRVLIFPIVSMVLFLFSFNITKAQTEPIKPESGEIIKLNDEKNLKSFDHYHPESHTPNQEEVRVIIENIMKAPPSNRIYFINGHRVSPETEMKLKCSMITDIRMPPPEESMEKFGVTGGKGTISFIVKK